MSERGIISLRNLDALQWIRKDIIELFRDASSKLEKYIASLDDEYLEGARRLIEESVSILELFSASGTALLCSELVSCLQHYRSMRDSERDAYEFVSLLIDALNYLPSHIDEIISHGQDYPDFALGTINRLRSWRSAPPLQKSQIFLHNISGESLYREASDQALMHDRVGLQPIDPDKCNYIFRQSFLNWLRNPSDKESIFKTIYVLQLLRDRNKDRRVKFFWWMCEVVFEAVYFDCLKVDKQLLQISGRIQKETSAIIEAEKKGVKRSIPMELVREMLYCIALARPETDSIKAIQKKFNLGAMIPTKSELSSISQSLSLKQFKEVHAKLTRFLHNLDALQNSVDTANARQPDAAAPASEQELAGLSISVDLVARELPAQMAWLGKEGVQTRQAITDLQICTERKTPISAGSLGNLSRHLQQTAGLVRGRLDELKKNAPFEHEQTQVMGSVKEKSPVVEVAADLVKGLARIEVLFSRYLEDLDVQLLGDLETIVSDICGLLIYPPLNDLLPAFATMQRWISHRRAQETSPSPRQIEFFSELLVMQQYIAAQVAGTLPGDTSGMIKTALKIASSLSKTVVAESTGSTRNSRRKIPAPAAPRPPAPPVSDLDATATLYPSMQTQQSATQTVSISNSETSVLDPDTVFIEKEFIAELERVVLSLQLLLDDHGSQLQGTISAEILEKIAQSLEVLVGGGAMLGKNIMTECARHLYIVLKHCPNEGLRAGSQAYNFIVRFIETVPAMRKIVAGVGTADSKPASRLMAELATARAGLDAEADAGKDMSYFFSVEHVRADDADDGFNALLAQTAPAAVHQADSAVPGAPDATPLTAQDGHAGTGAVHALASDGPSVLAPDFVDADAAAVRAADAATAADGGESRAAPLLDATSQTAHTLNVPFDDSARVQEQVGNHPSGVSSSDTGSSQPADDAGAAAQDIMEMVDDLLDAASDLQVEHDLNDVKNFHELVGRLSQMSAQSPVRREFIATVARMHKFAHEAVGDSSPRLQEFYHPSRIEALISVLYTFMKNAGDDSDEGVCISLGIEFDRAFMRFCEFGADNNAVAPVADPTTAGKTIPADESLAAQPSHTHESKPPLTPPPPATPTTPVDLATPATPATPATLAGLADDVQSAESDAATEAAFEATNTAAQERIGSKTPISGQGADIDSGLSVAGLASRDGGRIGLVGAPSPATGKSNGLDEDIGRIENLTDKLFFAPDGIKESARLDSVRSPEADGGDEIEGESTGDLESEVIGVFIDESKAIFEYLLLHIAKAKTCPDDSREAHLLEVKRQLHTLKGGLAVVGFRKLPAIIHVCEDIIDSAGSDFLVEFLDEYLRPFIEWFADSIEDITHQKSGAEIIQWQQRFNSLASRRQELAQASSRRNEPTDAAPPTARVSHRPSPAADEPAQSSVRVGRSARQSDAGTAAQYMRVKSSSLNELYSTSRELLSLGLAARQLLTFENKTLDELVALTDVHSATGLNKIVDEESRWLHLRKQLSSLLDLRGEMRDFVFSLDRQLSRLRDNVHQMSQLRFSSLENFLVLTAKRACTVMGRKAELTIDGGDVNLEKNLLDKISPALEHMVRNSIAHGIEDASARLAAGKPTVGEISISCRVEDDEYKISVSDDGIGIDAEKLVDQLHRTGLELSGEVDNEVLLRILCSHGVTTSTHLDELSGRGVGMDAVAHTIRLAGGRLELHNFPGQGCRFEISIPISALVVRVMQTEICGFGFCMRTDRIISVQRLPGSRLRKLMSKNEIFRHEGKDYSLIDPAAVMYGINSRECRRWQRAPDKSFHLLLFNLRDDRSVAFIVDKVASFSEQRVSGINSQLVDLEIYGQICLLDNGMPFPVVSREALLRKYGTIRLLRGQESVNEPAQTVASDAGSTSGTAPSPSPASGGGLTVMVVDDALTVRKGVTYALRHSEFDVRDVYSCPNSPNAISLLRDARPDVIFLDVDDLAAHTTEFLAHAQGDTESRSVVILMCSAGNIEGRRRQLAPTGVYDFMSKPFSLSEINKCLQRLTVD
ncbi:MAG: response regulator [Gammaproteobacteria bacterium]|nr:response regulator [Gammaproteobacteria bacterium]